MSRLTLVPIAALLLAACGDDATADGDGRDSGASSSTTETTSEGGQSSAGTGGGSGSTGSTADTTSDPGGWPECEPDRGVRDSVTWIDVADIENDSMYDQYADHDCTVTAVTETSVDFDCVGRDIAMTPSTPRVELDTSSPVTLPFSVDQVVRLRSRGYLGVIAWHAVSTEAGDLLLASTADASPMNPGEADWHTPLTVGVDEDVCPDQEETRRTAVTARLAGDRIVVVDGNEGSIGDAPSYLVRVSDAYVVLEDVVGGCQRCVTALIVAQP